MTYQLRNYQQDAVNAVISWTKKSISPCVAELPTGAGKSLIIAELSKVLTSISKGKKVLVLQPSKELLEQNSAKYQMTGEPYSLFSASVGEKSLNNNVVFATPQSVKNSLDKFDGHFCAIIMDECHLLSDTTATIIKTIKENNSNLRVIGLTATPFTMDKGLMYRIDEESNPVPQGKGKDQYFTKLVYKLSAQYLIDSGFLTQPVLGDVGNHYNTSELEVKAGRFTPESVDKAFVGRGRLTASIVNEIVYKAQDHKTVMIFGSTLAHCNEIMLSLPPHISRMIDGSTPKKDREQAIQDTKDLKVKYLVNCQTLTTGVDIESVSIIAILRATLSPVLITQIIGRSTRIYPDKKEALILDYTSTNINYFFPHGDLFSPTIKVAKDKQSDITVIAECELCHAKNTFSGRPEYKGSKIDDNGYLLDLDGNRVIVNFQPLPAHYGRRCENLILNSIGKHDRCEYRWSFKTCALCDAENDIAARKCCKCDAELLDPNRVLVSDFKARKKNPDLLQCDRVISWKHKRTMSKAGNDCLMVDFITEYRIFTTWFQPHSPYQKKIQEYQLLINVTDGLKVMPKTVTYKRNNKNYFDIYAFNKPHDVEPVP